MSEGKSRNLGLVEAHTARENLAGDWLESQGWLVMGEKPMMVRDGDRLMADAEEKLMADERQVSDAGRGERAAGQVRDAGGEAVRDDDGQAREARLTGNRAVVAKRAKVRDGVEALAAWLDGGEGEQLDFWEMGDDLQDKDLLAQAAETVAAPRRQRGRPKGAGNLRNGRVFDYLEAMGHRDPLVTLSMIQTADTRTLAAWMGIEAGEALRIQLSAAKEMLPYKYAKRPQEVNVNERAAHLFLTGTLEDMAGNDEKKGALSIFGDAMVMDNVGDESE